MSLLIDKLSLVIVFSPNAFEKYSTVLKELLPKNTCVSQFPIIVSWDFSYTASNWSKFCNITLNDIPLLLLVDIFLSKSGICPILANSSKIKNAGTFSLPPLLSAKSYNCCIICEKNIVSKKSYALCVSEDITYTAVFLLPIVSKSIVSVDVTSAISFESNLPSFDCKELNIEPYVFSGAISIDL